jgi:hypothetical protein
VVQFVASALLVFADEINLHQAGHCTATSTQPFLPCPSAPSGIRLEVALMSKRLAINDRTAASRRLS